MEDRSERERPIVERESEQQGSDPNRVDREEQNRGRGGQGKKKEVEKEEVRGEGRGWFGREPEIMFGKVRS